MSVIEVSLRVPLRVKTHAQRLEEAWLGVDLPATVVPARTTLRIVDLFVDSALALTPDGRRLLVRRETLRDHSYLPRRKPGAVTLEAVQTTEGMRPCVAP